MNYQVMEKPILNDKVKRVKESYFETDVRLSTERIRFVIEAYREAGGGIPDHHQSKGI